MMCLTLYQNCNLWFKNTSYWTIAGVQNVRQLLQCRKSDPSNVPALGIADPHQAEVSLLLITVSIDETGHQTPAIIF